MKNDKENRRNKYSMTHDYDSNQIDDKNNDSYKNDDKQ